jgi:hypothetical protein
MIEGWMVSAMFGFVTVIGAAFVTKYQSSESKRHINIIFERMDKHGDDIVRLNTKSELSMTAKDVDEKYVSKELFRQFEKHMDVRFDKLENGQNKILEYITKKEGKKS